jgi:hypothetical protein
MSLNGWSFLADAIRENGLGQIIGHGQQLSRSGGQMAYLLAPVLLGDFNHDDTVDAADYVVWRAGLETTYTQADYDLWRAHFGETVGSDAVGRSAEPLSVLAPEPSNVSIFVVSVLAVVAHGRIILLRLQR